MASNSPSTSNAQSRGKKRKILTLEQRMEVVKRSRKGETAISIARSFEVGKTQIQSIVSDQENVVNRWETGENCDRK
ncbi:hypothetical protein V1264_003680 [Littorina saxatilis]|uniref:HTH psq-type domain-containing protein n=1 Tax=Littorina saxatilis TaxID=31220 RepID=A0AAN9B6A4_9CAEN